MEFVTLRDLRLSAAEIQRMLSEDRDLVLISQGRPIAIITGIDEGQVQETLDALRQARAQLALARIRRKAREQGLHTMSDEEIEAEIASARRDRYQLSEE
jgi:antitoxin (DNA-binding transcriptional repressor) of toxin-antitoxin stability system